jgi:uncharacterized protein (TIGR02147 family)
MKEIYDYPDYRDFLSDYIHSLPKKGRGFKKDLAEYLLCQTTHISQVLSKKTNLTLDQGVRVIDFIPLTEEEKKFFMILLNQIRAGSVALKEFYETERLDFLQKKKRLKEKLDKKYFLDQDQRNKYYSTWFYPAIHVLLSIPEFQSPQTLIDYLPLPENKILEALNFLIETGLAAKKGEKYVLGKSSLEKPEKNSDSYKSFLKNWRNQAIISTDLGKKESFHNSIIFSISKKDVEKIKNLIEDFYKTVDKIIPESKEEEIKILSIDFFGI